MAIIIKNGAKLSRDLTGTSKTMGGLEILAKEPRREPDAIGIFSGLYISNPWILLGPYEGIVSPHFVTKENMEKWVGGKAFGGFSSDAYAMIDALADAVVGAEGFRQAYIRGVNCSSTIEEIPNTCKKIKLTSAELHMALYK